MAQGDERGTSCRRGWSGWARVGWFALCAGLAAGLFSMSSLPQETGLLGYAAAVILGLMIGLVVDRLVC